MTHDLTSLKAACQARTAASDAEKISEGESFWLMGHPVPADAGYISLSMGQGHSVTVAEAAILEVGKEGEHFLVRVQAGTAALVRSEAVITLRDSPCGCAHTPGHAAAPSAARPPAGTVGGAGGGVWNPCNVQCHWEWRCGHSGRYTVCIPVPICTSDCVWV